MVEQGTENPRVGGSIPPPGIFYARERFWLASYTWASTFSHSPSQFREASSEQFRPRASFMRVKDFGSPPTLGRPPLATRRASFARRVRNNSAPGHSLFMRIRAIRGFAVFLACARFVPTYFPTQHLYWFSEIVSLKVRIPVSHPRCLVAEEFLYPVQGNPLFLNQLAKVCRKSWKRKSLRPAFLRAVYQA